MALLQHCRTGRMTIGVLMATVVLVCDTANAYVAVPCYTSSQVTAAGLVDNALIVIIGCDGTGLAPSAYFVTYLLVDLSALVQANTTLPENVTVAALNSVSVNIVIKGPPTMVPLIGLQVIIDNVTNGATPSPGVSCTDTPQHTWCLPLLRVNDVRVSSKTIVSLTNVVSLRGETYLCGILGWIASTDASIHLGNVLHAGQLPCLVLYGSSLQASTLTDLKLTIVATTALLQGAISSGTMGMIIDASQFAAVRCAIQIYNVSLRSSSSPTQSAGGSGRAAVAAVGFVAWTSSSTLVVNRALTQLDNSTAGLMLFVHDATTSAAFVVAASAVSGTSTLDQFMDTQRVEFLRDATVTVVDCDCSLYQSASVAVVYSGTNFSGGAVLIANATFVGGHAAVLLQNGAMVSGSFSVARTQLSQGRYAFVLQNTTLVGSTLSLDITVVSSVPLGVAVYLSEGTFFRSAVSVAAVVPDVFLGLFMNIEVLVVSDSLVVFDFGDIQRCNQTAQVLQGLLWYVGDVTLDNSITTIHLPQSLVRDATLPSSYTPFLMSNMTLKNNSLVQLRGPRGGGTSSAMHWSCSVGPLIQVQRVIVLENSSLIVADIDLHNTEPLTANYAIVFLETATSSGGAILLSRLNITLAAVSATTNTSTNLLPTAYGIFLRANEVDGDASVLQIHDVTCFPDFERLLTVCLHITGLSASNAAVVSVSHITAHAGPTAIVVFIERSTIGDRSKLVVLDRSRVTVNTTSPSSLAPTNGTAATTRQIIAVIIQYVDAPSSGQLDILRDSVVVFEAPLLSLAFGGRMSIVTLRQMTLPPTTFEHITTSRCADLQQPINIISVVSATFDTVSIMSVTTVLLQCGSLLSVASDVTWNSGGAAPLIQVDGVEAPLQRVTNSTNLTDMVTLRYLLRLYGIITSSGGIAVRIRSSEIRVGGVVDFAYIVASGAVSEASSTSLNVTVRNTTIGQTTSMSLFALSNLKPAESSVAFSVSIENSLLDSEWLGAPQSPTLSASTVSVTTSKADNVTNATAFPRVSVRLSDVIALGTVPLLFVDSATTRAEVVVDCSRWGRYGFSPLQWIQEPSRSIGLPSQGVVAAFTPPHPDVDCPLQQPYLLPGPSESIVSGSASFTLSSNVDTGSSTAPTTIGTLTQPSTASTSASIIASTPGTLSSTETLSSTGSSTMTPSQSESTVQLSASVSLTSDSTLGSAWSWTLSSAHLSATATLRSASPTQCNALQKRSTATQNVVDAILQAPTPFGPVSAVAGVASVASAASAASLVRSFLIARLANCDIDDIVAGGADSGLFHVAVGDASAPGSGYRSQVVDLMLVVAISGAAGVAAAVVARARRRQPWESACAAVGMPGWWLAGPCAATAAPLLTSGVSLAAVSTWDAPAADVILVLFSLLAAVIPSAVCVLALTRSGGGGAFVCTAEMPEVRLFSRNAPAHKRALSWLVDGGFVWAVDRHKAPAAKHFVQHYGALFTAMRPGRHWYFLVDGLASVVIGLVVAVPAVALGATGELSSAVCLGALHTATAVQWLAAVVFVALSPIAVRWEYWSAALMVLLGVVSATLTSAQASGSVVNAIGDTQLVVSGMLTLMGLIHLVSAFGRWRGTPGAAPDGDRQVTLLHRRSRKLKRLSNFYVCRSRDVVPPTHANMAVLIELVVRICEQQLV